MRWPGIDERLVLENVLASALTKLFDLMIRKACARKTGSMQDSHHSTTMMASTVEGKQFVQEHLNVDIG